MSIFLTNRLLQEQTRHCQWPQHTSIVMKKDSSICFRASKDLRDALEAISAEDRRSLSSTISNILSDYLKKRKLVTSMEQSEKRQYPRAVLSVPAVINQPDTSQLGIAAITEISLGGLKILLPRELETTHRSDSPASREMQSIWTTTSRSGQRLSMQTLKTTNRCRPI